MDSVIRLILGNIPILLLILSVILAFSKRRELLGRSLTHLVLLLPIGVGGLWGFYYHAFYPEQTAANIGWADSPFQLEVAVANLGMGLAGLIGFWKSKDFAIAVAIMATCFLGGAAFVHLKEIAAHGNLTPGNAGSILFSDILIPIVLWIGIALWKK